MLFLSFLDLYFFFFFGVAAGGLAEDFSSASSGCLSEADASAGGAPPL